MAGAFRIAEGYVEVTADETNYDRAMQRLRAKKHKATVTLDIDDSAALAKLRRFADAHSRTVLKAVIDADLNEASKRRVTQQLDRLTADRVVNIRASADTRVAAAEIANLTRRRQVRIGIDVDTRVAADSLANLTRRRQMTVQANADTAAAAARIDTLTRRREVDVRLNVNRSSLAVLSRIGGGGGGGGAGILSSTIARLAAVIVGALPTLASLGQSLAAMGPAAALAVPSILSLATAFAAVKVGMSGVGAAFKAAFAPAAASAGGAASAVRQVENAERSLAKAQQAVKDAEINAAKARIKAARDIKDAQLDLKNTVQDVADANRRAARQIADAERDLADAQRDARKAQEDLTEARKEAAEQLEDLQSRLANAELDQRQAVLDLQEAEEELAEVRAKGSKATAEELEQAELNYDKAAQRLKDQQTETARLREETAAANAAGIEGSESVVRAKEGVADANRRVTDQTRQVAEAEREAARTQEEGAQRIARAQRDVADAQAAAAEAAADGARQIADAQDAVAVAAQALADAQASASSGTNALATAMARLAPNAQAFVNAVVAQGAAWRAMKLEVQNRLFEGLASTFTTMSVTILPSVRDGLVGMAGVLNQMAVSAMNATTELARTGTLRQMFDGLTQGMQPLANLPAQIITGLAQISVAASPAFARLTTAAEEAANRTSERLASAFKSGALEQSINNAIEVAKQFGSLLGDIFGTIGNIMDAAAAGGGDALGSLGAVFAELRRITAMPEVQQALTSIFEAVHAIAKLFAGTLGAVIEALLPLLEALAPVVVELAEKFGPVLAELAATLGEALAPIIDALLPIVSDIGDIFADVVVALLPLLKPLGELIGTFISAWAPIISEIGAALVPLIAALAEGLTPVIEALVPLIEMAGEFLAAMAPMFPQLVTAVLPLIPPLSQLTLSLITLAMQVLTPLMPLITGLATLLSGVLAGAIGILVPVITTVIGWLQAFVDMVTDAVKWVVDKFTWLYDVLVGHSIIPDLVKSIIGWFTQLWTKTKELFTQLKNWVVNTWNNLWGAVRSKWNTFWSGLKSAVSGAWKWVKDSVSGLRTSISNTWSGLWNGARDKISSIFTTIRGKISDFKSAMKQAFSTLRDSLGKIWDGIKSKIGSPVKWVVGTVYNNGIRKMWNSIAGKINSSISLPTIKLGFNKGGVVPGQGNRDTVPAMLTPGERILSNEQVAKLGGHRAIDAMLGSDQPTRTGGNPTRQQERRQHQPVPGFADGGIIGNITSAIGGTISGAVDWTKDLVVGGLKAAAEKALKALVRPLINQIPNSGIGNLLRGLSNKAVDGMLDWFTNEDKKAVGGPGVQKALSWVKTQHGLPYQWGGNGNPSWDCLTLSSVITTPQGHTTLRDLHPGMEVMAYQDGKLVSSKVLAKWNTGEQELFKVRTRNRSIRATAGHRVLVAAPVKRPMMDVDERVSMAEWGTEWKHVRDLTPSDYLVTYTGSPKEGGEEVPDDLAWLMGLWLADGSVNQNSGIRICVYGDLAEKAMAVLRKYSPHRKVTHHPRHGVMISDIQRVRWMLRNGFCGKSHERTVPPVVMEWSQSAQDAFLRGYADGDGSYRNGKNGATFETAELIEYKATSHELIEGIREMHLRRGDRTTVIHTQARTKDVYIGGKKIENARSIHSIEVTPGRGASQSTGAGHRPGLLRLVEQLKAENMSVQRVLSVEPDGVEETWDIEVEGSHSFVSDGLISHNCSGLMSAIESVIRGERPHRRWATGAFVGNSGPAGWVRNLNSPFMIGITNAGVGHTAGTIAGVNVESRGGDGVIVGKRARSYKDSLFTSRWGFAPAAKFDSGGLLQPGATLAVNATGRPERILDPQQTALFEQLARQGGGMTVQVNMTVNSMTVPSPAERRRFATSMAADIKEALRQFDRGRV